jgi:hypothetical protein
MAVSILIPCGDYYLTQWHIINMLNKLLTTVPAPHPEPACPLAHQASSATCYLKATQFVRADP